jgi:hypothetical protein
MPKQLPLRRHGSVGLQGEQASNPTHQQLTPVHSSSTMAASFFGAAN